jgi:hypothetical protein
MITPNVLRGTAPALEVHAKPWAILFMALLTPGIAGLYVGTVWEALQRPGPAEVGAFFALIFGIILGPIFWTLIASGVLWLRRVWTGTPFLLVDRKGLVWGRDRERDITLAWSEIERIETKRIAYGGYRHRFLVVVPKDPDVLARYSRSQRLESWLVGGMISRLTVGTIGSTVPFVDLVAEIHRHFPGPIDLADRP